MNFTNQGIGRGLALCLLALTAAGCGGGGGGDSRDGGFLGPETRISVEMSVGQTLLPLNFNNEGPARGGPFTTPVTVAATIDGRPVDNETIVQYTITNGHGSGFLYCLLNDEDGECFEEVDGVDVQVAFQSFPFETTGGIATMFFHAGDEPGTVTITATVTDPASGRNVSDSVQITVAQGNSTQKPAIVQFLDSDAPLYVTGQGQVDQRVIEIRVRDDAFQEIPNPTASNLRVELLPGRPNGGERLVGINAQGGVEEGTVVHARTLNGVAQVTLRSGTLPGNVRISATADRADNNVDNGISNPVVDITTETIGSGLVRTLTFTGPFPGAVAARANDLGVDAANPIFNGVYFRDITIIAADEFGQPPPPGTEIALFLGDGPLLGYPEEGHGEFVISAEDGNIEEGGFSFTTPATGSSFAQAAPNCLLFFQGGRPDREGVRIITGVSPGGRSLTVNTPFNDARDLGFTVPYTITCAPTQGNVENFPGFVSVQTNENGVASTVINYPITQLGRSFCLGAQAAGGQASSVLCGWYLGITDGSFLTLNGDEEDLVFTAPVGGMDMETVTVQLFDGNNQPLPAEPLDIEVVIEDPDATDAILARDNADLAQARAEDSCEAAADYARGFFTVTNANAGTIQVTVNGNPQCIAPELQDITVIVDPDGAGGAAPIPITKDPCITLDTTIGEDDISIPPEPGCSVLDSLIETAASDLSNAIALNITANEAERRDALYNPTATFEPARVVTGAQGLANVKFTVNDLAPNGQVTFFITTVGPEIIAPTRTVTFQPEEGAPTPDPQ